MEGPGRIWGAMEKYEEIRKYGEEYLEDMEESGETVGI